MKKFRSIISFLLVVLILMILTSCGEQPVKITESHNEAKIFEPKTAVELWEKIDRTMGALDSYESDINMEMTYFYLGKEIKIASTAHISDIDSKSEYSSLTESDITLEIPSENKTENIKTLEAFYNGKMYIANKSSSFDQKFVSEITAEKYRELQAEILSSDDIDFSDCTNSEFSKTEDGSWEIEFSGYTKKTVDGFLNFIELKDEELGASIDDIKMKVTCTDKFLVKSINFEFVFDEDASVKPSVKFSAYFNTYNEATIDTAKINDADYNQVPDAYILDIIKRNYDEYISAQKGAFNLNLKTSVEVSRKQQSSESAFDVDYGLENGSFYYNLEVTEEQASYSVNYKSGLETINYNGETITNAVTTVEATEYIKSLMDVGNFDKYAVSSIKRGGAGIYTLTIPVVDDTSLNHLINSSLGITVDTAWQKLNVVLSENKLKKATTQITINGKLTEGNSVYKISIIAEYVVVFDPILTEASQEV